MNIDFGFGGAGNTDDSTASKQTDSSTKVTDINGGNSNTDNQGNPITDLGDIVDKTNNIDPIKKDDTTTDTNTNNKTDDDQQDNDNTDTSSLEVGTVLEVGDDKYTVDVSGNLVDKDGNIFKESKDVKEWVDSFENVDDSDNDGTLSVKSIQDVLGVDITDEDDQPIEFDNTPEGVASYVQAVIETREDELKESAINQLYQQYPIISDVLNYYVANGNSLEGFNQQEDRSNITIDDANIDQQESIIRTAWKEQNRKGDVDGYIQYLKSSGTLAATSREELAGLQEADEQYKQEQAKKAQEVEQARIESLQKYWNGVNEVISSKNIAGYTIPDTIIINKDGKKTSATPKDFFNYVYQVDNNGVSTYEKELSKDTPESRRDDELLRAYLKFTGGSYSSLVGMAVNKDKVANLRLKAKNKTASSVRISKPKPVAQKGDNVDLGFK